MSFLTLGLLVSCGSFLSKPVDTRVASDPMVARSFARKTHRPLLVAFAPNENAMDRVHALLSERSLRSRLDGFVPVLIDPSFNFNRLVPSKDVPAIVAMFTVDSNGKVTSQIGGGLTTATLCSYLDRNRTALAMGQPYAEVGSLAIRRCVRADELRCAGRLDEASRLIEDTWSMARTSDDRFETGVRYASCSMLKGEREKAMAIINEIAKLADLTAEQLGVVANYRKRLSPPQLTQRSVRW